MTADPISFNSERISSIQSAIDDSVQTAITANADSTQQMIDSAVQSAIESNNESLQETINESIQSAVSNYHNLARYMWDTANGIDSSVFESPSSIVLDCEGSIRCLRGTLTTKSSYTFGVGTSARVLPSTKLRIGRIRYFPAAVGDCYFMLDTSGLVLMSTATTTLSGSQTIKFSYTYIINEETEVHTNE